MKKNQYLIILPLCAIFLFNGKTYNESVVQRIGLEVEYLFRRSRLWSCFQQPLPHLQEWQMPQQ